MSAAPKLWLMDDMPCRKCGSSEWTVYTKKDGSTMRRCKPCFNARQRELWPTKERNRPYAAEYTRERHRRIRLAVLQAMGGRCARCGYDEDHRALQIDHVHSDGAAERKSATTAIGSTFYLRVLKELDSGRYQLLCANCNWIKRYECDEHPPKGKRKR